MKQTVKVIKTQSDYDAAIARLSLLMSRECTPGSTEEQEQDLLSLLIDSYENIKSEAELPTPIEAILFLMDQQDLTQKDLVPYIGSLPKVSEVLSGKRPLSLRMIRNLHAGLKIPAEILIRGNVDDAIDLSVEPSYNYAKFPLQEMLERHCFPEFNGGIAKAKDYAEDLVRKFMKGIQIELASPALLRAPLHQAGAKIMDEYALLVWRICVLKKARAQKMAARYKKGAITSEWLRDLAKLSRFETGPKLAQEFLSDNGIALVIEKHFAKTYLDGAAMLDEDRPIIGLTLRHDRVDNFWFALMHELIHVDKHLSAKKLFIADNLDDKTRVSTEEDEADAGAREALVPAREWNASNAKSEKSLDSVNALANKLRIHPAIVAGRVRYEANNWRILTGLVGSKDDVLRHF